MSTPTRLTEEPILKAGESLTKDKLVNFIKNKEGFSNVAYKDGSQYSIGYGTKALNPKETISEEEAEQRFLEDLNNRENFIRGFSEKHGYNWDDQQIYSLTDFHYNVGQNNFLNLTGNGKRTSEEIAKKIPEYNTVGGKHNQAIQNRRWQNFLTFSDSVKPDAPKKQPPKQESAPPPDSPAPTVAPAQPFVAPKSPSLAATQPQTKVYEVQAPNGKIMKIEGPIGATDDQLIAVATQNYYSDPANIEKKYTVGQIASKALDRGFERLGSTAGDVIPAMVASGLGFDDYAKKQLAQAQKSEEYIQRNLAPQYDSYKDVSGIGSGLKFGLETALEQVPNLLTTLIPGGVAGQAAKIGAGKLAATELAKRQAVARGVGVYLGSYALNAPEVFQNVYRETGQLAPGASALFSIATAALDSALPKSILDGMSPALKGAVAKSVLLKSGMRPGLANTAFKGFLKGAGQEGITEGAQEGLSIAAENFVGKNPQIFDSADWGRIMESSVRGAVAGGIFRGISAPIEQKIQDLAVPPLVDPAAPAPAPAPIGGAPTGDIQEVLPTPPANVPPISPIPPTATPTQASLPGFPEELAGPTQAEVEGEPQPGVPSGKGKQKQKTLPFPSLPTPKPPVKEDIEITTEPSPFSLQITKEKAAETAGLQYDPETDTAFNPETSTTLQWSPEAQTWKETKDETTIKSAEPESRGSPDVGSGTEISGKPISERSPTTTGGVDSKPVGDIVTDGSDVRGGETVSSAPLDRKTPIAKGWATFISDMPYAKLDKTLKQRVTEAIRDGYFTPTLAKEILDTQRRNEIAGKTAYVKDEDTTIEPSLGADPSQAGAGKLTKYNNAQEVRNDLYKEFGRNLIDKLLSRGRLNLIDSAEDLDFDIGEGVTAFYQFNPKRDRFRTGKTTIIANRNPKGTARDMLLHEIGEHYGLEGMLGDNYLPTLIQLNKLKDTDSVVAAAWAQVTRNYTGSDPVRYRPGSVNFLREVAAHIGETAPQNTWFRYVMGMVKNFLRRLGFYDPEKITSRDLQDMILYSLNRTLKENVPSVKLQLNEEVVTYPSLYSADNPPGAYSPKTATKLLDMAGAAFTSIREGTPKTLEDVRDKMSSLPINLREMSMGMLGLPAMVQLYHKYVPSFKKLMELLDSRAGEADRARAEVDRLGSMGMKIIKGDKRNAFKFVKPNGEEISIENFYDGTARVSSDFKIESVPSQIVTTKYSPDMIKNWTRIVYDLSRGEEGNARLELGIDPTDPENAYHPLVGEFKQLPAELQMLAIGYSNVFQQYAKQFNAAILKLLPDKDTKGRPIPPSEKAEKYKEQLVANQLVFYHPFRRKGQHVLKYQPAGRTPEGFEQEVYVERFETPRELDRRIEEIISSGGKYISSSVSPETARTQDIPPNDFFQEVIGVIKEQMGDSDGKLSVQAQEMVDQIYGFYIDMFPSSAVRQNTRARKGTRGELPDIVGGFIDIGARMANQVTNMEYIPQFNEATNEISEQANIANETIENDPTIEPAKKEGLKASVQYAALDVTQKSRHFINNPVADPLSGNLAYLSFLTTIAGNMSSAIVNLSQMLVIVGPGLIAKHGIVKGSAALFDAIKIYKNGGLDNNRGYYPDWSFAMKNGFLRSKENAARGLIDQADVLPEDILTLYEAGLQNAVFRRGLGYELTEMRKKTAEEFTGIKARVDTLLGWMFQNTERFNREVTYLASYLAEKNPNATGFDAKAAQVARDFTRESHGTALPEVGPRYFQTGWGKTIFTFKRYAHAMMSLLIKLFHESTKGGDAKRAELAKLITETSDPVKIKAYEQEIADLKLIKYAARKQLVGIYGMSFTIAGLQGMPLYGAANVLSETFNAMFGDDDEPYDFDEKVRDIFGDIGYKGPLNKIVNADVAARTGFSNLIFREESRRISEIGVPGYIVETALGPAYGYMRNVGKGIEDMNNGFIMRGSEEILPAFLRNPLKAVRYANEGARTRTGAPLVEDLGAISIFMQVFGFTNEDLALNYERNNTMKNAERRMLEKREGLLTASFLARDSGDREMLKVVNEKINAYNASTTGKLNPITADTRESSYKKRKKAIADSVNGVTISKKYREYLKEEMGS